MLLDLEWLLLNKFTNSLWIDYSSSRASVFDYLLVHTLLHIDLQVWTTRSLGMLVISERAERLTGPSTLTTTVTLPL